MKTIGRRKQDFPDLTTNLNINFIGAPHGEHMEAEAVVTALRKRMAFVDAMIRDAAGDPVARASVVFFLSSSKS